MLRIEKHHPAMIVNDIERNLTPAGRPADKGHNDVVCIVEQELIARTGRNLFKGNKRVGTQGFLIAHPVRFQQPLGLNKEFIETGQLCIIQLKHHVGFMDNGGVDLSETVIELIDTRRVIGANGIR